MYTAIEWMIRHPVASNLLMVFIVFTGLMSILNLKTETFPEANIDIIEITVEYPGASPTEIEESIIKRIEEEVESIDGIDAVISTANENMGTVRLELIRGQEISKKRDEVNNAVDKITAFPEETEEPQIREIPRRMRALQIAISGDMDESSLKELAYQLKDDLVEQPDISYVTVSGVRDYEVSVEISRDTLRAYNLTLPEISAIVRQESLDLPGGDIETADTSILLKTVGRNYYKDDFEDIIVASNENGGRVSLKQIANINDGFVDNDLVSRLNGQPVAMVNVFRVGDEPLLKVVDGSIDYIEHEFRPALPPGVDIRIWRNDAEEFTSRMASLRQNGIIAIFLVVALLALFLNTKVAFWVSAGIGIAFLGSFTLAYSYGLSVNNVSSFGIILAIGIVVDDAIVVGENIYASRQHGIGIIDSAVRGAQRVAIPVVFAVMTTLAAFLPIAFLPGSFGMILDDIPLMVIFVLILSLIEALLILPHHLASSLSKEVMGQSDSMLHRCQNLMDARLSAFVEGPLTRTLEYVTRYYWLTICAGISLLIIGLGFLLGGYVKFEFFPSIPARYITVTLEMDEGTPADKTLDVARLLESEGQALAKKVSENEALDNIMTASYILVGESETSQGPQIDGGAAGGSRSHVASVVLELVPPELRDISIKAFEDTWRSRSSSLPGVRRIQFSTDLVGSDAAVGIEVAAGTEEELRYAIQEIRAGMHSLVGVKDIRDDNTSGKTELQLRLRPEARNYGLSLQDLAMQVRGAFFGAEALRVQRGREEVKVYVRLPEDERNAIDDLANYWIRTPTGDFIPIWEVLEFEAGLSPTTINRRDGRRIVTVEADSDSSIITGGEIVAYLETNVLPRILDNTSSVKFFLGGEERDIANIAPILARNLVLAMFAIYVLLAIPFRSYIQPLIVMSAIPFACMGALFGHYVMGFNMSFISLFGVVGLCGVVINGALVLLDFANEGIRQGKVLRQALIDAAKMRFRPILLTSLTTFVGVSPLMLDPSTNGKFLAPIAVSLGFGVLFGATILMLMVPALSMGLDAIKQKITGHAAEPVLT